MNARESHLLKEQSKRDAKQRKAERIPPLVLFGTVRRFRQNSHKGYQKYGILDIELRESQWCDHAVRITLEDQGKVKKRRTIKNAASKKEAIDVANMIGDHKPDTVTTTSERAKAV